MMTKIHINALSGIAMLFTLALVLLFHQQWCSAVGVAGLIAPIAMHFAQDS